MTSYSNLVVEPIFATPLAMVNIQGDQTLTKEAVAEVQDWKIEHGQGITPGHHFLAGYPELERQILEAFYAFKDGWLGLSKTEFRITSSWMTLCEPGAIGFSHRHFNSMFTGVYYPFPDEYSNLEFSRSGLEPNSFFIDRDQSNMFSTSSAQVKPYESLAVFFPSYVSHRFMQNTGSTRRHSIAFNFHPVGNYGIGDSTINITDAKPQS